MNDMLPLAEDVEPFPRTAAPLGWAVGAISRLRRAWAGRSAERLGAPTISVGNLAVGGTGKTPLCREIASWLAEAGRHVAVLSRGYARPQECPGVTRVSRAGRMEALTWRLAGDEAWMLASTLPHASVYVSRDRAAAGRDAVRDGAEVLLLDDGFQHLRVARDLDVVCLRGDEAALRVLPAGPLREPPAALRSAHAAVWIHEPCTEPPESEDAREDEPDRDSGAVLLRSRLRPGAMWAEAVLEPGELLPPEGGSADPATALRGARVGVLCAIARPARLVRAVQRLGARIEAVHTRRDHHVFAEAELAQLRRDLVWVTTEKDAVRLDRAFPAWVLRARLRFLHGEPELRRAVRDLRPAAWSGL